jgi:hypothetical protein
VELRKSRGFLTAARKSADSIIGRATGKALQGRKRRRNGSAGNDDRRLERLRVASRTGDS